MAEDVKNPTLTATGTENTDPTAATTPTNAGATEQNPVDPANGTKPANGEVALTEEQLKAFKGYGGVDHALELLNRQRQDNGFKQPSAQPASQTEPSQPVTQPNTQPSNTPATTTPQGWESAADIEMKRVFKEITSEYDRIPASEVEDGTIAKQMTKLGIQFADGKGNFNTSTLREFLNIYNATKPAPQPGVNPSAASNVPLAGVGQYNEVAELSSHVDEAKKIFIAGDKNHPQWEEAKKVFKASALGITLKDS